MDDNKKNISPISYSYYSATEFSIDCFETMCRVLEPNEPVQFATLEKLSVLIGKKITLARFYGILDSVKHAPWIENKCGYFYRAIQRDIPNLPKYLQTVFVRPIE